MDISKDIRSGMQVVYSSIATEKKLQRHAAEAQIALPHLLSGEATWIALQKAIDDLVARAPQDHDVLIEAFGLNVLNVQFIQPHTFLFEGFDGVGNQSGLVCHFTQVVARVVYLPKRGPERVITGFGKEKSA